MQNQQRGLIVLGALIVLSANLFVGAGGLNPPAGPVQSTMKTLDEVKPGTPINAANTPGDAGSVFKITVPGLYYLSGNITGEAGKSAILIASDGVTIDLGGFTISGDGVGLHGIEVSPANQISPHINIRNGTVSGFQGNGIEISGGAIDSGLIVDVTRVDTLNNTNGVRVGANVSVIWGDSKTNGNALNGILVSDRDAGDKSSVTLGDGTASRNGNAGVVFGPNVLFRADDMTIVDNTQQGIIDASGKGTLNDVAVVDNGGDGLLNQAPGVVLDNVMANNNGGNGLTLAEKATVKGCGAKGNQGNGVNAGDNFFVSNFLADGNGLDGIVAGQNANLQNVSASNNGGDGFELDANAVAEAVSAAVNGEFGLNLNVASTIREAIANANGTGGVSAGDDVVLIDVAANNNTGNGINLGDNGAVRDGQVANNTGEGIHAGQNTLIQNTTITGNISHGASLEDGSRFEFSISSNNGGTGVLGTDQGIGQPLNVNNVTANNNTVNGISVGNNSEINNATANGNDQSGIFIGAFSTIRNSTTSGNGFIGILANGTNNTIINTNAIQNPTGVQIGAAGQINGGTFSLNEIAIKVIDGGDNVGIEDTTITSNFQGPGIGIQFGSNANCGTVKGNRFAANITGVQFPGVFTFTGGNRVIANFFNGNTTDVDDAFGDPNKVADFVTDPNLAGVNSNQTE